MEEGGQQSHYTSGKESTVPTEQEAGWASELVWMLWRIEKPLAPARNQTPIPQPFSQ
jgi:hypothetical protein